MLRQEKGLAQRRQDARAGHGHRPEKGERGGKKEMGSTFFCEKLDHGDLADDGFFTSEGDVDVL